MSRRELIEYLKQAGQNLHGTSAEVDLLIEHYTGLSKSDLLVGKKIDANALKTIWAKAKERVETKQPLQYLIGKAYFMGERFNVNSSTLIPRPETEILVNQALKLIGRYGYKSILDIGTGTGCIAITISKLTKCEITAVDICDMALQTANENMQNLCCKGITLLQSDIFAEVNGKFDLIVSNPPYIPPKEKNGIQLEVGMFEPHKALFTSDEQGIEFYQKIITDAHRYLNRNGAIAFELGIGQSILVKKMFEQNGFTNIEIIEDIDGIDRVISGILNL